MKTIEEFYSTENGVLQKFQGYRITEAKQEHGWNSRKPVLSDGQSILVTKSGFKFKPLPKGNYTMLPLKFEGNVIRQ